MAPIVAACLLAPLLAGEGAREVVITVREAPLRSAPRVWAAAAAAIREGEFARVVAERPPWLLVGANGDEGWFLESECEAPLRFLVPSASSTAAPARTEGAAMLPPSVRYQVPPRALRPDLEAGFRLHDEIEHRPSPSRVAVVEFRRAGGLEPEGGEGR